MRGPDAMTAPPTSALRRSATRTTHLIFVVAVVGLAACLYDPADRCSPGQVVDPGGVCICAPNHVPVRSDITVVMPAAPAAPVPIDHCVPCGERQVVRGDACVCTPGYVTGPGGCVPSNLGAACAGDADCATGDATTCRLPEGYCTTRGCASNAECNADADYACVPDAAAGGTYCKRPPLNQDKACTTQGVDPTCGNEAPVCALGACTVLGCAVDTDCSPRRKCCDLSRFSPGVTLCLEACP
jgi:hypothetical protein